VVRAGQGLGAVWQILGVAAQTLSDFGGMPVQRPGFLPRVFGPRIIPIALASSSSSLSLTDAA